MYKCRGNLKFPSKKTHGLFFIKNLMLLWAVKNHPERSMQWFEIIRFVQRSVFFLQSNEGLGVTTIILHPIEKKAYCQI